MDVPLTAEIHREGDWFVAFCPEVPEANGLGKTREECLASLREAILPSWRIGVRMREIASKTKRRCWN